MMIDAFTQEMEVRPTKAKVGLFVEIKFKGDKEAEANFIVSEKKDLLAMKAEINKVLAAQREAKKRRR